MPPAWAVSACSGGVGGWGGLSLSSSAFSGGGGWVGAVSGAGVSGIVIIRYLTSLQSYSEATIKTQGSYALKAVATTSAINKTLTKTFAVNNNLTGVKNLRFDMRSSRTGANVKLGLHDTGGTTTELTPTIATADTYQTVSWDISGVSDANKDAIDTLTITIMNADSANTFYLDYFEILQGFQGFWMG